MVVAALVWTPTHNLVTREGFAEATVTALRSSAGRAAVADEIEAAVSRQLQAAGVTPPTGSEAVIRRAVDVVVADRLLGSILRDTISGAYGQVVERGDERVSLDLNALRDRVAAQVARADPELARQISQSDDLGSVEVSLGDRAPSVRRLAQAADLARVLPPLALAVGVLLLGLAVAVSRRRSGTALAGAIGMATIAAIPLALRLLAPPIARSAVESRADGSLVEQVVAVALEGWWVASLAALLIAAALAVLGLATRGADRRPAPRAFYE